MSRKIYFHDIEWETDGKIVDLPTETILDVPDGFDIDNDGADLLSDTYGWLTRGFFSEEIVRERTLRIPGDPVQLPENNT